MPRNFSIGTLRGKLPKSLPELGRDPRVVMRLVLGALLLANLVAALVVFKPWAGSAEDLEREAATLRQQVQVSKLTIERLTGVVAKVETARAAGDEFERQYFTSRRVASSTMVSELNRAAQETGIKQKESTFLFEPVEGSEVFTLMTVNAGYEGTFADLMQFINVVDRSPKFLILESLTASPQQNGLTLNVNMKLNAFVREGSEPAEGSAQPSGEAAQ